MVRMKNEEGVHSQVSFVDKRKAESCHSFAGYGTRAVGVCSIAMTTQPRRRKNSFFKAGGLGITF